ncbi:MAG: hypothetical protein FWE28_03545 [Oscillospiraceae bacterium]|nr:hypothetical protein [Oscillospiraceae bacterium]
MYFDPGFGSMIVQVLLGGLAFFGVLFATMRHKIAALFGKKPKEDAVPTEADPANDNFEQVDTDE